MPELDETTAAGRIVEGLQLLADAGGDGSVNAQHDTLYAAGPAPDKMGPGLRAELERLKWYWNDCAESWCYFT